MGRDGRELGMAGFREMVLGRNGGVGVLVYGRRVMPGRVWSC